MARVLSRTGLVAVALCAWAGTAAAEAQGQSLRAVTPSSRQADDRRADESPRQTQAANQPDAPKPAEASKPSQAARSESKPSFQRQPEPQRQAEPQRQRDVRRQGEPARRDDSDHWSDPGPAWRAPGPAWRNLNDRPGVGRPGEDAFRPTQGTYAPRSRDSKRDVRKRNDGGNAYYTYPYVVPYGFATYYPAIEVAPEPAPEPAPNAAANEPPLGFLALRVQPRSADVFVDGTPAGTVDDFGGRSARMLTAGPHRIEIVAAGFETLTVDVRVPENDTVTFTRDLEPAVARPAPEPISVPHKALYVVPMCFIGDRPPLASDMPAGCRVEDVRVIP